jgi:glycosyltransferase involved in cell wall biosynthesis
MSTKKDILFLLPYPIHRAPSQRFRVEHFLYLLDEQNKSYTLAPFMTEPVWRIIYQKGNLFKKALGIVHCFLKRWILVICRAHQYQYIYIHREAAPLGPPILEWFLAKLLHKKIIYDFDDAIWIPNTSNENRLAGIMKSFWKVASICKWAYKISAGNDYLAAYARAAGARQVFRIPTVVNTISRYNCLKEHHDGPLVLGWTGSHSTLKFLDELIPIIQQLQTEYEFTFLVIADKKPELQLKSWVFCPWNEHTEIEDLLKIDIGVMPLTQDQWSEGKCGFKLIQYLSLGIPAIAQSVGVNKDIIDHGKNGFIADSASEWMSAIRTLLQDTTLRQNMGKEGRRKMKQQYSIAAHQASFVHLFT